MIALSGGTLTCDASRGDGGGEAAEHPGRSTLAAQLERTADETADVLRTVSEAVFDRTYMDSQIATHEWLLRTVDETLMPAARREDVRAQLRMVRATALVHLERARKVLSVLAS
jgi:predicted outer membrane protein